MFIGQLLHTPGSELGIKEDFQEKKKKGHQNIIL